MGVFNKTPYTNFHELNLNWIIKKIKEVAADNAFFKQFFKTIEDEHILGVVTKVTENNNNTVKTDYLNESTQQMDNYIAYNKTGTDGAISGAVTPIATRVTSAEGRLDSAETNINSLTQKVTTLDHVRVYSNTENATTFTITGLQNITQNRFRFGLLYCADTSNASVYVMALNGGKTTGNLVFIPLINNYRSFTGSFESGVLTLTANKEVYGGIRVLWID